MPRVALGCLLEFMLPSSRTKIGVWVKESQASGEKATLQSNGVRITEVAGVENSVVSTKVLGNEIL